MLVPTARSVSAISASHVAALGPELSRHGANHSARYFLKVAMQEQGLVRLKTASMGSARPSVFSKAEWPLHTGCNFDEDSQRF